MNNNRPFTLDAAKSQLLERRLDLEFSRNPRLLEEIDRRLSVVSQQVAFDAGTHPAAPTYALGSPDVARPYSLAGTATLGTAATVDGNESRTRNGSFLFESFTQVRQLVEAWAAGSEGARHEVYRSAMAKVQEVIEKKRKTYETKQTNINTQIDTSFNALNAEATEINRLAALLRPVAGGTFPTIEFDAYLDVINLSKDQLAGRAPITVITPPLTINTTADLAALNTEINNRFNTFLAAVSVAGYPAADPNLANIKSRRIAGLNNALTALANTYDTNLTDHNGRNLAGNIAIRIDEINSRNSLLQECYDNIEHPVNEEVLNEDERFKNVIIDRTASVAPTLPVTLYMPRLGGAPNTPFIRGNAFTPDDYFSYFKWARKNYSSLTPEQKEVLENCEQSVMGPRLETQLRFILDEMRRVAGGRNATPADVIARAGEVVTSFLESRIPGIPAVNDMGVAGSPENNVYISLIANHYKLDIKNTDSDLRNAVSTKLEEEFVTKFNLPTEAEQKQILEDNRKAYASTEGSRNVFNTVTRLLSRRRARANYLASTSTNIYNEMRSKYSSEDLSKPDVRSKFTAEMVQKIMQARLDVINDVMSAEQNSLLTRLSEKIKEIPGATHAINAGLLAASVAAGAYLNPGFFTPALDAVKSGAAWAWEGSKALLAANGGWGKTLIKGAGILSAGALGYRVINGTANVLTDHSPWSRARQRQKESIMGTTNIMGDNTGGLGSIDRAETRLDRVYKGKAVQKALASQLALAAKYQAGIAKNDSDKLNLINSPIFKKKFETSDHLWEREKQGLSAVINRQITTELSGPADGRTNRVILESLRFLYGADGTERTFLEAVERSRTNRQLSVGTKFIGSAAAGAGLGNLFAVTF